jgi:hypothetical protein
VTKLQRSTHPLLTGQGNPSPRWRSLSGISSINNNGRTRIGPRSVASGDPKGRPSKRQRASPFPSHQDSAAEQTTTVNATDLNSGHPGEHHPCGQALKKTSIEAPAIEVGACKLTTQPPPRRTASSSHSPASGVTPPIVSPLLSLVPLFPSCPTGTR